MPSQFLQSTPTTPTHSGGSSGEPLSPAKFNSTSPSKPRSSLQSPIRPGCGMPNDDAKEIAERRRARQSMSPTKPLGRFDSICKDSKAILEDMAGMFSTKKGEAETPKVSPFKIKVEVPPSAFPVKKKQSRKDLPDDQRGQGQVRRKKVVNPGRIRQPRPPEDRILEEGSSKRQ